MTITAYRDIAASNGHTAAYELAARLLLNGWTTYAKSDGTTRTTSVDLTSAAELNASGAFVIMVHTVTGLKYGMQRKADSNTWTHQVTEGGQALSGGNATTMDSNATYTKTLLSNSQWYPSTGTTTTKLHIVCDSATASFAIFVRRTPFVGGSTSACAYAFVDYVTPATWSANPQPWVAGAIFANGDTAPASLIGGNSSGWYKRGGSGETWSGSWVLENPGSVAGSATTDPSGSDCEFETRWANTNVVEVRGKSVLFRLVQPYRTPTGGMDGGASFARAAFGQVTVANDGTALAS